MCHDNSETLSNFKIIGQGSRSQDRIFYQCETGQKRLWTRQLNYEPLYLIWWNFTWTCIYHDNLYRNLLNFKVIDQRLRSCFRYQTKVTKLSLSNVGRS